MRDALAAAGREGRHNIFFALYPSQAAADGIVHLTDRLFEAGTLRGRRVTRDCLHVSLYGLGCYDWVPSRIIDDVCAAVSHLKMAPFRLALNAIMSFDHHDGWRPRVLTGDDGLYGVDELYDAMHLILKKGRPRGRQVPRIARPHLTLSREETLLPDALIEPVHWTVRDFRLIHSPHGESRHIVLGCWPLEG
jgi:2'-5' RNA ligase